MNTNVRAILKQIMALEHELANEISKQQQKFSFQIKDGKVAFQKTILDAQKQFKAGIFAWLMSSQLRNILSIPLIYPLIVVFLLLDFSLLLFQLICFNLYQIPKVERSEFFVFDRHHLKYLNVIQKINCFYCSYVSGLLAYAREIAARTEQYWCPIKHAYKIRNPHINYVDFVEYGDAENFSTESELLRESVKNSNKNSVEKSG